MPPAWVGTTYFFKAASSAALGKKKISNYRVGTGDQVSFIKYYLSIANVCFHHLDRLTDARYNTIKERNRTN